MKKIAMAGLLLFSACAIGPDYQRPQLDVPVAYKETGNPDSSGWKHATPQDETDRGAWWEIYKDPVLDGLEKQIELSNQNLKAAEAAFHESQAVVKETRSALFPSLTLNAAVARTAGTMPTPGLQDNLYGVASWTPDVWGRIRRNVESDEAKADASMADLAAAKLSLQANLAMAYFDLRAQDELKRLYDRRSEVEHGALQIAQRQYDTGQGDLAAVLMAQTQFEDIKTQSANAGLRRAQLEHAIAVLIGKPPSGFSLKPQTLNYYIPTVPAGLPSVLLERRPDIAAAERAVAAANAQIGVAQAAWFPDLTLSGSGGVASMTLSKLLQASNSFWAVGPALAETIFDGGAREAREDQVRAAYDRSVAVYRQTVLTAFQQVEDNLAAQRILGKQSATQEAALAHTRATEKLARSLYEQGTGSYDDVLATENARLTSEQALLMLRQNRYETSVALIQALGGGWAASNSDKN